MGVPDQRRLGYISAWGQLASKARSVVRGVCACGALLLEAPHSAYIVANPRDTIGPFASLVRITIRPTQWPADLLLYTANLSFIEYFLFFFQKIIENVIQRLYSSKSAAPLRWHAVARNHKKCHPTLI